MADTIISVGGETTLLEKNIRAALSKDFKLTGFDAKSFTQPLGKIKGQLGEFEKSLEASNARVVAFGASAGSIYLLTDAFKSMVKSTIEVEKTLADINTILNVSERDIKSFGDTLFNVANKTSQSFQTTAEAALEFSRQGLTLEQTAKRTADALTLAKLSGLSAAASVEALTAAINSFSDAGLTTAQIVNKLAAVDARYAVSSADLAEAIKRVGSSASEAGVNLDQLIALVTSAQQTTARGGAVIGNSFKTIFTRLQRPKVLDDLKDLGINTTNAYGQTLPLVQILTQLAKTFDNLGDSQKSQVAELVGGVYQINILKAVLGDLTKGYSTYSGALKASSGASNEAEQRIGKLAETIDSQVNRVTNNLKRAGSVIGDLTIAPALEKVLSKANSVLETFSLGKEPETFGEKAATGFLKGLGSFIAGPGLLIAAAGAFKIFQRLAVFVGDAGKTILGLGQAAQQQAQIQAQILNILQRNPQLYAQIESGAVSVQSAAQAYLNIVNATNIALEKQKSISSQIAASAIMGGATVSSKGTISTKGRKGAAGGFIPSSTVMSERLGAMAGGYKPGKVVKSPVGGVMNTAEDVKYVPGFSQPFINPPAGSKAGRQHKQNSIKQTGVDPYAYGGFIPNFADKVVGEILGIKDGDTITGLPLSPKSVDYRLANVDAPEKNQKFSDAATSVLASYYKENGLNRLNEKINAAKAARNRGVFDDRAVAQNLVSQGLGVPDFRYTRDTSLLTTTIKARNASLGIWSDSYTIGKTKYYLHPKAKQFQQQKESVGLELRYTKDKKDVFRKAKTGEEIIKNRKFFDALTYKGTRAAYKFEGFVPNFAEGDGSLSLEDYMVSKYGAVQPLNSLGGAALNAAYKKGVSLNEIREKMVPISNKWETWTPGGAAKAQTEGRAEARKKAQVNRANKYGYRKIILPWSKTVADFGGDPNDFGDAYENLVAQKFGAKRGERFKRANDYPGIAGRNPQSKYNYTDVDFIVPKNPNDLSLGGSLIEARGGDKKNYNASDISKKFDNFFKNNPSFDSSKWNRILVSRNSDGFIPNFAGKEISTKFFRTKTGFGEPFSKEGGTGLSGTVYRQPGFKSYGYQLKEQLNNMVMSILGNNVFIPDTSYVNPRLTDDVNAYAENSAKVAALKLSSGGKTKSLGMERGMMSEAFGNSRYVFNPNSVYTGQVSGRMKRVNYDRLSDVLGVFWSSNPETKSAWEDLKSLSESGKYEDKEKIKPKTALLKKAYNDWLAKNKYVGTRVKLSDYRQGAEGVRGANYAALRSDLAGVSNVQNLGEIEKLEKYKTQGLFYGDYRNKKAEFDKLGRWNYDAATKKMFLKHGGFVPNFADVGVLTGDSLKGGAYKEALQYLAETNKPINTIIGPAGSGKTTRAVSQYGGEIMTGTDFAKYNSFVFDRAGFDVPQKDVVSAENIRKIISKSNAIDILIGSRNTIKTAREQRVSQGDLNIPGRTGLQGGNKGIRGFTKAVREFAKNNPQSRILKMMRNSDGTFSHQQIGALKSSLGFVPNFAKMISSTIKGKGNISAIKTGKNNYEIEGVEVGQKFRGQGLGSQLYKNVAEKIGSGNTIKSVLLPQEKALSDYADGKPVSVKAIFPQLSWAKTAKSSKLLVNGKEIAMTDFENGIASRKYNASKLDSALIELVNTHFSGFIPNFNPALKDAVGREMAAGYSKSQIRIGKSSSLVSNFNPEGLGVYNSTEGNLGKGMQLAKKAGINPKTKGMSAGFIPNFAFTFGPSEEEYYKSNLGSADQDTAQNIRNEQKAADEARKRAREQAAAARKAALDKSLEAQRRKAEAARRLAERPGTAGEGAAAKAANAKINQRINQEEARFKAEEAARKASENAGKKTAAQYTAEKAARETGGYGTGAAINKSVERNKAKVAAEKAIEKRNANRARAAKTPRGGRMMGRMGRGGMGGGGMGFLASLAVSTLANSGTFSEETSMALNKGVEVYQKYQTLMMLRDMFSGPSSIPNKAGKAVSGKAGKAATGKAAAGKAGKSVAGKAGQAAAGKAGKAAATKVGKEAAKKIGMSAAKKFGVKALTKMGAGLIGGPVGEAVAIASVIMDTVGEGAMYFGAGGGNDERKARNEAEKEMARFKTESGKFLSGYKSERGAGMGMGAFGEETGESVTQKYGAFSFGGSAGKEAFSFGGFDLGTLGNSLLGQTEELKRFGMEGRNSAVSGAFEGLGGMKNVKSIVDKFGGVGVKGQGSKGKLDNITEEVFNTLKRSGKETGGVEFNKEKFQELQKRNNEAEAGVSGVKALNDEEKKLLETYKTARDVSAGLVKEVEKFEQFQAVQNVLKNTGSAMTTMSANATKMLSIYKKVSEQEAARGEELKKNYGGGFEGYMNPDKVTDSQDKIRKSLMTLNDPRLAGNSIERGRASQRIMEGAQELGIDIAPGYRRALSGNIERGMGAFQAQTFGQLGRMGASFGNDYGLQNGMMRSTMAMGALAKKSGQTIQQYQLSRNESAVGAGYLTPDENKALNMTPKEIQGLEQTNKKIEAAFAKLETLAQGVISGQASMQQFATVAQSLENISKQITENVTPQNQVDLAAKLDSVFAGLETTLQKIQVTANVNIPEIKGSYTINLTPEAQKYIEVAESISKEEKGKRSSNGDKPPEANKFK